MAWEGEVKNRQLLITGDTNAGGGLGGQVVSDGSGTQLYQNNPGQTIYLPKNSRDQLRHQHNLHHSHHYHHNTDLVQGSN